MTVLAATPELATAPWAGQVAIGDKEGRRVLAAAVPGRPTGESGNARTRKSLWGERLRPHREETGGSPRRGQPNPVWGRRRGGLLGRDGALGRPHRLLDCGGRKSQGRNHRDG